MGEALEMQHSADQQLKAFGQQVDELYIEATQTESQFAWLKDLLPRGEGVSSKYPLEQRGEHVEGFILGLFALAFFVLAFIGFKIRLRNLRSLQKHVPELQDHLMHT